MSYVTGHSNVSAPTIELAAPQIGAFRETSVARSNEKWPLWWTVLGVTVFCATFWTALFSIIF